MRDMQLFECQQQLQPLGISDIHPVSEEHRQYAAVCRVVMMRHRVDNICGHDFFRNLIGHRCPNALNLHAYWQCDFAQHEVDHLIDQLERHALVDLVGRNGFVDLSPVVVDAICLGGDQNYCSDFPINNR